MEYIRKQFNTLKERILEPRMFMQVLAGPRQVGKSTLVGQVLERINIAHTMEVADGVDPKDSDWIHRVWEAARTTMTLRRLTEYLFGDRRCCRSMQTTTRENVVRCQNIKCIIMPC